MATSSSAPRSLGEIPLERFMRVGFPKFSENSSAATYTIEYVGPFDELTKPKNGDVWGDFPGVVSNVSKDELGLSGYALMTVSVEEKFGEAVTAGTVIEVAYEKDWAAISRPLFEHKEFNSGGGYALSTTDLVLIELWRDEPSTDDKIAFKVYKRDSDGNKTGSAVTLSAAAQKYCTYLLRQVETFTDYAPILRKSSTYAGGPPADGDAGIKTTPFPGFPGVPSGTWEYLKNADRSTRAAGQRRWKRDEELLGAFKVLIDNRNLYL